MKIINHIELITSCELNHMIKLYNSTVLIWPLSLDDLTESNFVNEIFFMLG